MEKAGLIDEMMDDTLNADEELSDEADEQLDMGEQNTVVRLLFQMYLSIVKPIIFCCCLLMLL